MSSVWLCIPSARPPEEAEPVLRAWRERGYKIALFRDDMNFPFGIVDYIQADPYPGYARAVNALVAEILRVDNFCDWIVCGGDDTLPDPHHSAEQIALECSFHFGGKIDVTTYGETVPRYIPGKYATWGVMQPSGDRFASGSIDRIAGSPWMGREWCLRANKGQGPLYPEFEHMFVDEALKRSAEKLGVYWMRPDLIHFHKHFMRRDEAIDSPATRTEVPPHLVKWNTREHWNEAQGIFKRLEAENFASCDPL